MTCQPLLTIRNFLRLAACAAVMCGAVLSLSACGSKDDESKQIERPVESLYNEAADKMDAGEYEAATKLFNEVERQHPYSQWATRAQLMAAYGYYKAEDYDQADLTLDRFIKLHPGHRDIDYAYYLKALCFYEQISDVGRDQAMTQLALENLDILIRRFPDSKFTRDALLKRDLTLDHLAGKEMEIGRYYLTRGQYVAAINRFREVVRNYQTTTHTPEALHRMVEAYMRLGLRQEAARVAAVLGYNYPGSSWYEDSYKLLDDRERARLNSGTGFVDRTIESIFGGGEKTAPAKDAAAGGEMPAVAAQPVEAAPAAPQELPSAGMDGASVDFIPTDSGKAPAPDFSDREE